MTQSLQMSRYRRTHVTAVPGDQNPHDPIVGRHQQPRRGRLQLRAITRILRTGQ
jgi:hypothetical protein